MRRRGLTLVEALIVLAVITIVVALLTPVFMKVKQNARDSRTDQPAHWVGVR